MQAHCGALSESGDQAFATRGGNALDGRVAHDGRAECVGHDQPAVLRDKRLGEILPDREEEGIAKGAVFLPFPVGAKIGNRAFNFDDGDAAVCSDGEYIGPASIA